MNMKKTQIRSLLVSVLCSLLVLMAACAPVQEASRWDTVQEETTGERATSAEDLAGGEFNKFFPDSEGDFSVVYTQEKSGFAEAVLKENGEDVATLAVADTVNNPSALEKYSESTQKVGGYPAAAVGDNGTAILVADRLQVQVRSVSDAFSAEDRETWLQAFDLDGLAQLVQ